MTRPSDTEAVTLTDDEVFQLVVAGRGMCAFYEDINDASMCICGLPALGHDETVVRLAREHDRAFLDVVASVLAARLAGAGAQVTEAAELPEHEKNLRDLWRELAEKRIEQGVDWPRIVLTLFADIDRLAEQAIYRQADEQCAFDPTPHIGTGQSEADLRARISALADEWKRLRKTELSFLAQRKTADAVEWCERELRALLDRPAAAEGNET